MPRRPPAPQAGGHAPLQGQPSAGFHSKAAVRAPPAQDSSVTGLGTVLSQGKLRRNGEPVKISNVAAVRADFY